MSRLRFIEILLFEVIIYFLLWMWNDYLASLLSAIFASIFLLVLVTSFVIERIEKSNVPRLYFTFMIASVLAPLVAAGLYVLLYGSIPWLSR